MARTQAPDYEQRRKAILDVAARLFAGRGFAETSMTEVAAASAMSKSLLYHYFLSKEDILHGVMASHIDELEQDVAAVVAIEGDAETRLTALVHRFMEHYAGAADRQKVLLNELDSLPAANRATIVGKQRHIVKAAQDLIGALYPTLAHDPVRSRAQTMLLFGMINWTHTWFDPAGPLRAGDLAEMVLDLTLPTRRAVQSPSSKVRLRS